ncbi:MAG TPA: hypothetical protein VM925_32955 [Labilithrix sp.]|nr:hypothetical protein [Labilithrix sp.]
MDCSSTRIDVTVRDARGPVEGVEVSIDCPQLLKPRGRSLFGKTDAGGRLEFREPATGRSVHDGCALIVGGKRFPMKSVSKAYSAHHCVHAVIERGDFAADLDAE